MALPSLVIEDFRTYLMAVRTETTVRKYLEGANRFMLFCGKHRLSLDTLPIGVLGAFTESMNVEQLRPSSISVYLAGARAFLEWLRQRGDVKLPPVFSRVHLPKIKHAPPNALRNEDLLNFLREASRFPEPWRTAILILPFCGLRGFELCGLTLDAISKVSVPAANGFPAQQFICFTVVGKGGTIRTVPLLMDGRPLLLRYLQNWRRSQPGRWLFPSHRGEKLPQRTLSHYVKRIKSDLKITQKLTPHTLRRTYLTTLHRAGLDIPTLTRVAGHKSVQTTMTHYLEILPEDVAGAVGRSGARLVASGQYADDVKDAGSRVHELLERIKGEKT